jgi:peptide/nickel transport system permease protein
MLVFIFLLLVPGTAVDQILGQEGGGTSAAAQELQRRFGLDQPAPVRYLTWLQGVLRGDFGVSWRTGLPVLDTVLERLPLTLEIAFIAVVIAILVGVPLGALAAARKGSLVDHGARVATLVGAAIPVYVLGTILLLVLSTSFGWIPPTGYVPFLEDPLTNLSSVMIPAATLGILSAAGIARMTRGSMLEVLDQDYIRTARSKGLAGRRVITTHALRNALIPVITLAGLEFGTLLGGAVITETIFSLPGIGRLVVDAISQRDYPVVQGAVMVVATAFILVNLGTDLMYGWANPRIRYG